MKKYYFLLSLIFSINVSAQKEDSLFINLDSAIVTSRSIKILDTKNSFVISSITNKQIIEKGARTTPEALQGVSGVFIQKTNHGGGSAFIRGLTGNQTLIVLDGIRLNNAIYRYGPNQYLNTIDMFTVDKIDVLKGVGSVEYGSDAMGGVIHVKTKENASKELNKISLNNSSKFISSDMEKTNRTAIQYATNKWDFIGGISLKKYGDLVGGGNIGKQTPTGYNEINYDLKTRIKINNQSELIYSSQNTIQKNVTIYQSNKVVLSQINLDVTPGEFLYIIGKTGTGKSSFMKTLYGDLSLTQGEGSIVGFDLKKLTDNEIPFLRRKIGIVFQDFQLLPDRSVFENMQFVLKATGWKDASEMKTKIDSVLESVGMLGFSNKMPHQLSGGEQQRVAIARALLNDPEIILADEPTGNLDPQTSVEVMNVLKKINESGRTIIMATHDYALIMKFPSKTLKCEENTIFEVVQKSV